jgi:hypothetical protein
MRVKLVAWILGVTVLVCALGALAGQKIIREIAEGMRSPAAPFEKTAAPPAPDFARQDAWLAFPGRNGPERSTPPGIAAIDEAVAPADVFFIHPTSYLGNDVWNAPYDAKALYNPPILLNQISAFNGCCRLYAPQYRQASLHALNASLKADDLAYGDIRRAFRWYIDHENHGRPFILASHSQGSMHAVRLLQDEILGAPLRERLVAAYVVGAFAPADFGEAGLPTCERADQTGCIVSWNTSQTGRKGAFKLTRDVTTWWKGAWRKSGSRAAICTNPLTWNSDGAASASANPGAEPFPKPPYPATAATLPPLVGHLTGAVCRERLLDVDIPGSAPSGFHSALSLLYGSYHQVDYGVFYAAIRDNAVLRVGAWGAAHGLAVR